MSTDDDLSRARTRRHSILPADPSEDELARHWTLTSDDLAEIAQCHGADHRRRFALQLCTLRAYGRFLDDYRQAPLKIVSHLSVSSTYRRCCSSTGRAEGRRNALSRCASAVISACAASTVPLPLMRDWLRQGAVEGRSTAELLARAEDELREWRVMLPAISTLERIAVAEVTYATTNLFEAVTGKLPESLRASIDLLVEVPEGDARSSLFRLKDYPKSASAAVIKSDIVRLCLIEELLGTGGELDELDPKIVRQLGELGRR
jgi:hypothetical protein